MALVDSQPTGSDLRSVSQGFEGSHPEEVLRWTFATFGDSVALASSFGGASGAVLLDIAAKINPSVKVFYLDTDFLFPETHALIQKTVERYGITPVAYRPELTPEEQAALHGQALWTQDPDRCCELRKVEPNAHALAGLDAWITGIRRDQGPTRSEVGIVEWDHKFKLVKVNPVAHWSKRQLWSYILANKVPYNALLDQGYQSIGCTHCTRPTVAGEDERAGRWSGRDKVECGLHA